MLDRTLSWEALANARDLGGLPLVAGGVTRPGRLVRTETVRQLSPAGWEALVGHGVRTIVDLRFPREIELDEPLDAAANGAGVRPGTVTTVAVSVFGEQRREHADHLDAIGRREPDEVASARAVYLEALRLFRASFVAAVGAIADASPGGVVVHCYAGKDRTGLVVALALAAAGVEPAAIAEDYALSGPNVAAQLAGWVDEGADEIDREHRRRAISAPALAMTGVLEELESCHGGAAAFLLEAGLQEDRLEAVVTRLTA